MRYGRTFSTHFTFHNAGQGLFYSGRIGDFNFIYDCGSEKKVHIQSVVSEFKKNTLGKSTIDLLVLSHLHSDHVSGLDVLLDRTVVDTVVLPYLSPKERLMVALEGSNSSAWLRDFWADPVSYLDGKNVRRIVLFGVNEASPPEDVSEGGSNRFEGRKMDIDRLLKDEKLENQIRNREKQSVTNLLDQSRLLAKRHNISLMTNSGWLFRFFNVKQRDQKQDQFEECVTKTFPDDDLIDVIRDKSRLETLRTCYNMLGGDFNDTSLVLYHGPISGRLHRMNQCDFCPRVSFHRTKQSPNRLAIRLHRAVGHFLTGDVNFSKWTEISKHYGPYLFTVALALVPHHGSRSNWRQSALSDIANACWVTSAGISNKHGHPDPTVCQTITNSGSALQCTNEGAEVSSCGLFHT